MNSDKIWNCDNLYIAFLKRDVNGPVSMFVKQIKTKKKENIHEYH